LARNTVQNYVNNLPKEPETSLAIKFIVLPESQPRRYFDPEKIQQLADSIREYGILEPLLVRPIPTKPNFYELVAGERRYRAATLLNLETVPVVIRELDDRQALAITLVENLTREDLNPVEEAEGILKLLELELGIERTQVTSLLYRLENEKKGKITRNIMGNEKAEQIEAIFTALGQNCISFTTNRLPILKLPENILEALRQGKLEYTKAIAIAKIKEEEKRAELLEEAIQNQLSLTQIKARIVELKPSSDVISSENKAQTLGRRLKQLKLWEKDKKAWKKVEGWLDKIENFLLEIETDGEKIASQSSDLPKISSANITAENQGEHTAKKSISEKNADTVVKESPSDEEVDGN
jgi:ParB family chromosome partitioning protein